MLQQGKYGMQRIGDCYDSDFCQISEEPPTAMRMLSDVAKEEVIAIYIGQCPAKVTHRFGVTLVLYSSDATDSDWLGDIPISPPAIPATEAVHSLFTLPRPGDGVLGAGRFVVFPCCLGLGVEGCAEHKSGLDRRAISLEFFIRTLLRLAKKGAESKGDFWTM